MPYKDIQDIALSEGGYDIMALVRSESGTYIVKNGHPLSLLDESYLSGTYQSNGSHSVWISRKDALSTLIYDGARVGAEYDEIREVFLEENGGYYAYFARPKGEKHYCLITKYHGNLCGLSGYMNPRLSADGSSILYAGLSSGKWGIYRNTDIIVRETHYDNTDISHDYAFFDTTNPRTYLFVKRDLTTKKYILIKNGKRLP